MQTAQGHSRLSSALEDSALRWCCGVAFASQQATMGDDQPHTEGTLLAHCTSAHNPFFACISNFDIVALLSKSEARGGGVPPVCGVWAKNRLCGMKLQLNAKVALPIVIGSRAQALQKRLK